MDTATASLKKRIVTSTVSQVSSQILVAVLGVITLKIITNDLGVESYGVYATVLAFVSMFSLLTDLGLNAINGREIAKHPENTHEIIGQNIGLRIALCVVMVPVIYGLSYVFYPNASNQLRYGILLLTSFLFFDAIRATLLGYFTAHVRGHIVAAVNGLQQIFITILVVVVAITQFGFYGYIFTYIFANTISMLVTLILIKGEVRVRPLFSISKWRGIMLMSLSLGIIQLINMMYLKVDSIMLSVIKGTTPVGIYGIAYSLIVAFLMLPSFIMTALIPSMATSNKDTIKPIVQKAFEYIAVFACLLAAGSYIVRNEIVLAVSSASYAAAAVPFAILGVASAFSYLNSVFGFASVALNKHHKLIIVSIGALCANILLNLLLIPKYSYNGAACATLITELLALIGVFWMFRRETGVRPKVLKAIVKPGVAALVTLGAISVIRNYLYVDNNLIMLCILSAETTVIYTGVLILLRGLPTEVSNYFARLLRKVRSN